MATSMETREDGLEVPVDVTEQQGSRRRRQPAAPGALSGHPEQPLERVE